MQGVDRDQVNGGAENEDSSTTESPYSTEVESWTSNCGEWNWSSWSACTGFCIRDGQIKNSRRRMKIYTDEEALVECAVEEEREECGNIPCPGK